MVSEKKSDELLESLPSADRIRNRLSEISIERQALEKLLVVVNRRDKIKESARESASC